MQVGWIKLHRKLLTWEWFTDVNTCHLFTYLLLSANHQTTKWRGETIHAGQLLTGRERIAAQTGLSIQNVRTSLKRLESTREITSIKRVNYSIITITNWKSFQESTSESTSHLTSSQPAIQPAPNHIQEYKEDNNEKKIINIIQDKFDLPLPENVFIQTWRDFHTLRKKKRAPITETTLNGIIKEAAIANFTLEEALQECCTRGWQSFKAEWINNSKKDNNNDDKHRRTLEAAARGHMRAQNPDF